MLKGSQKLLGTLLEEAGLVTAQQIQIALEEQSQERRLLGEILALHGWIKPETVDFFAHKWGTALYSTKKKPLERYFKEASLLDDVQILTIIKEQRRTGKKFGEVAVHRGWLNQKTVDFFAKHLSSRRKPRQTVESLLKNWSNGDGAADVQAIRERLLANTQCNPFWLLKLYQQVLEQEAIATDNSPEQKELLQLGLVVSERGCLVPSPYYQKVFNQSWVEKELAHLQPYKKIRLPQLLEKAESPHKVLEAVLSRTKGEPFLSQQLCQLIAQQPFIHQGEESVRVEQLVQTHLIENWQQGVAADHLQKIGDQLLQNPQNRPLLQRYQQILQRRVAADGSPQQLALLETGLVVEQHDQLQVANPIYRAVFNQEWVTSALARLPSREHPSLPAATEPPLALRKKADSPYAVVDTILAWTNNQPLLTPILYRLVYESDGFIRAGQEGPAIERLVRSRLIDWHQGAAAEHLHSIRDRLAEPSHLRLYQELLQNQSVRYSNRYQALLDMGLVKVNQGVCTVHNRIYQEVFNLTWVKRERAALASVDVASSALQLASSTAPRRHRFRLKLRGMLLLGASLLGSLVVATAFSRQSQLDALIAQGNRNISAGDYEAALASYQEVLKTDANFHQAWTNRGYALAGLQQYRQMLDSCETATLIKPEAIHAWNCQGEAHHNLSQYRDAIADFDRAIALAPDDSSFLLNKGESLLALEQLDEALAATEQAIAFYQEAKQEGREVAIALSLQGRIHRKQQQYEAALADYERALSYASDYIPAQRGRALTLRDLGRYERAQAELTAILNDPQLTKDQKAEIWFYQGLTLCDLSQPQAGGAAFEQALVLKPGYEAAAAARRSCG